MMASYFVVVSDITSSPRSWSVDDVAKFIEKTDLKDFAALFKDNVSNIVPLRQLYVYYH